MKPFNLKWQKQSDTLINAMIRINGQNIVVSIDFPDASQTRIKEIVVSSHGVAQMGIDNFHGTLDEAKEKAYEMLVAHIKKISSTPSKLHRKKSVRINNLLTISGYLDSVTSISFSVYKIKLVDRDAREGEEYIHTTIRDMNCGNTVAESTEFIDEEQTIKSYLKDLWQTATVFHRFDRKWVIE